MNKNELIELKKKLDIEKRNKSKYVVTNGTGTMDTIYTKDEEIKELHNEVGTVDNIETFFERVIYYLSENKQSFEELNAYIVYSLFIKESDFDEYSGFIKEDAKVLEDYVELELSGYKALSESGREMTSDPEEIYNGVNNSYIVSLSEFKKELYKRGFDISTIQSFEEIKEDIFNSVTPLSKITISFSKPKAKIKKQIG